MKIFADLHLHSKYSRATSGRMNIETMSEWAEYKGINLVGTCDFTHPLWFSELKNNLCDLDNGLFAPKNSKKVRFILSTEISSIYSQGGQVRKIHNVIITSSLKSVEKINEALGKIGNLYSDGRPILGLSAKDLLKIVLTIDPTSLVIPAHIWTPWFSLYGSKSGFNHIIDCYEELTKYIYAIETGLSSDPEMNWRIKELDNITITSNSDAHSPENMGREANIMEVSGENFSYGEIADIISSNDPKRFLGTIEFYPEEGKYHYDGHRACGIGGLSPAETKKLKGICPKCKKPLTVGVMNRVDELADPKRSENYKPENRPKSIHLVPLAEIIAEFMGTTKTSKKVQEKYLAIINQLGNEFSILLDKSQNEIEKVCDPQIAQGIMNVRANKVSPITGYDGVYGTIRVLSNRDISHKAISHKDNQNEINKKPSRGQKSLF